MNVLVTGGAGYIGSHTVVELLKAGHDAIIVDDLSNAKADVIDRIETITEKRPAFHQIDCADGEALRTAFEAQKIDGVIHFAGFKAVGESVKRKACSAYSEYLPFGRQIYLWQARRGFPREAEQWKRRLFLHVPCARLEFMRYATDPRGRCHPGIPSAV